jgi:hypothetical protein
MRKNNYRKFLKQKQKRKGPSKVHPNYNKVPVLLAITRREAHPYQTRISPLKKAGAMTSL